MRLGVFGGTFDPPHLGHLAVCRAARDALNLDRVEMIPAAMPPHGKTPWAAAPDRYAMVTLALLEEESIVPSPRELERGGVSYTIDTLDELRDAYRDADLVLIIGGDSYDDLPSWRDAKRIRSLAHLAVIERPGTDGLDRLRPVDRGRVVKPGLWTPGAPKVIPVPMTPTPISASEIRGHLRRDERTEGLLDSRVARYIALRGLYRPEGIETEDDA